MNELNAYLMNFLLLCLLLLIGYCLINFYDNEEYFKQKSNSSQNKITLKNLLLGGDEKDKKKNEKLPELKLYSVEWCGHCRRFKKEGGVWEKLNNNQLLKNKCKLIDIDGDQNQSEVMKNDIEGFPTLILFTKNKKIVYQGDRTEKDIIKFLKKHIKNLNKSKKTLIK